MKTYNEYFNESWEYLDKYHNPSLGKHRVKWNGFAYKYTLDMSIKPNINKTEWATYINAVTNVLNIGRRENFLIIHVDGQGRQVFWTVDKP